MQIIGEGTLHKFDKLKQKIFLSKKEQIKTQYQSKIPVKTQLKIPWSLAFKLSIFGVLAFSLLAQRDTVNRLWGLEQKITDKLSSFTPLNKRLLLNVIWNDSTLRLKTIKNQIVNNNSQIHNNFIPNFLYQNSLESILFSLQQKTPEIILYDKFQLKYKFWLFGIGANQQRITINQLGDTIRINRKGMIVLGKFGLRPTKQQVIQRNQDYQNLTKICQIDSSNTKNIKFNFANECNNINYINSWLVSKEENDEIIRNCSEKTNEIQKKIIKQFIKRQKRYSQYE